MADARGAEGSVIGVDQGRKHGGGWQQNYTRGDRT
jgi:hypothetical protein